MMAMSKKMQGEPGEIEMLLPWHAAGTLNARDARRVEEALARDPELAKQYAVIREEYAETIHLNESLGAPSVRAMQKLFAAIDGEPVRKPQLASRISTGIAQFFASLSPRTMAWSAGAAALRAAAAGRRDRRRADEGQTYQTASLSMNEKARGSDDPRARRNRYAATRTGALCARGEDGRHQHTARQLSGHRLGGANGLFRLQFGSKSMGKDEVVGPDEQAARREDRQPRRVRAVRCFVRGEMPVETQAEVS